MGDFFVTVDGPRGDVWQRVLGTRSIPVLSPVAVPCDLTGANAGRGVEPCYLMDLAALSFAQRGALVEYLAVTFEQPQLDVAMELDRKGVPVRAEGCTLVVRNPQKWI